MFIYIPSHSSKSIPSHFETLEITSMCVITNDFVIHPSGHIIHNKIFNRTTHIFHNIHIKSCFQYLMANFSWLIFYYGKCPIWKTHYIYICMFYTEKPLKVCLNELPMLQEWFSKKSRSTDERCDVRYFVYIYDRVEKDVGRGYGWRFNENIKNFETLRSML